jgi:hypothetical protein
MGVNAGNPQGYSMCLRNRCSQPTVQDAIASAARAGLPGSHARNPFQEAEMHHGTVGTQLALCGIALLLAGPAFAQTVPNVQTFALRDTTGLVARNVKMEAVEYKGRRAVRLTKQSFDEGFVLLPATDFQDGTIEADVALKVTTPPGVRMPGFIGIAFRARPDASHFDLFYLRPGNSQSEDQLMRNHSVQYSAFPDFGWYRLRTEWPGLYEAYAELEPETWTRVRIEVTGRSARLFLHGSVKPSLVVDGLKGADLHGAVALWGFPGEEAYFANVRITPAVAHPLQNGADATGTWDVKFTSDVGILAGTMTLSRVGDRITGAWSGALGDDRPVTGTWRDGYVQLAFTGDGAKAFRAPGAVTASLSGWIDGPSAQGRMKVEGQADGPWVATKRQQ